VYGVGYWCAARDPLRHWPIVLVGFLGKTFGPIGFVIGAVRGELPWSMGVHNVTNDLIWWFPFLLVLLRAWDRHAYGENEEPVPSVEEAAAETINQHGESLAERLSKERVLLLAVRHTGCTFCRAELADLAKKRDELEAAGVTPAVLTMSAPAAAALMKQYDLDDLPVYSDPNRRLYRALGFGRGEAKELFGPTVCANGVKPFLQHGVGKMDGDGFQMGGAALLAADGVLAKHAARHAADAPNLVTLAQTADRASAVA
ncbi:MAG: peroxiredoxin-like family protein, partial [Planctomycetota bacterium]